MLSLFIYNTFGFLAVHPFLSIYYKNLGMQQAEELSEKELLELLVFNKKDILKQKIDFKWIHSREFRYKGEMYDVVKKEENNNKLFLYCINDKKEKRLEKEFEKRVNNNSTNSKRRHVSTHFNILLSEPVQSEQLNFRLCSECIFNYYLTDSYNSIHSEIQSPPPRLV
jgi:hypothetical protein